MLEKAAESAEVDHGARVTPGKAHGATLRIGSPKRRGSKPDASARQIEYLSRDIVRLRRQLERAELMQPLQLLISGIFFVHVRWNTWAQDSAQFFMPEQTKRSARLCRARCD